MSPIRIPQIQTIPKGIVSQADIGGGLTLKANRYNVPLNQMQILRNWMLVEDGSLIGRRGTQLKNATAVGSGAISGAARVALGSNLWLAAASDGTVYQSTDGTTFAASGTGFTAGSPCWIVQYLQYAYVSTKADPPKKFDGTTWTNMGLAPPLGTPTATAGAAGVPNGQYTVQVTFQSPTMESNPSPASAPVTAANQQILVTGIPVSTDSQTTARIVYAFKQGVSSTYQRVGVINDNTTTTFTVTTDQNSWTSAPPLDHNPPVAGAWLTAEFKNRLWKAGDVNHPNRLYFSQIFIPEAWPTSFFIDIPFEGGGAITALFVLGDLLLVFGDNAVFYVFGDTPFAFVVKQSFAQSGCPSPWAIDRVQNACLYLSRFGVYAFDGAQANLISDPIDPQFTGLYPQFPSMNYATAQMATMKYYDRLKAIILSFPTEVANDTTYWYFLRRQGWVQDTRAARLFLVDSGAGDQGNLYAWDAADGSFRQWDMGYTDDGTAITAEYKTGALAGDNPLGVKVWNWFTLRAQPANATVNVTATLDGGVETDTFTLGIARGAVYGTAIYGTSTYGAALDDFEERFAANMKGREVEIGCALTYREFIRVTGMLTTYTPLPTVRRHVGTGP